MISQIISLGSDPEFVQDVLEQIGRVGAKELAALHERELIPDAVARQCETEIHRLDTSDNPTTID